MRILIETDPGRGGWQLVARIVLLVLVLTVLVLLGAYLVLREAELIAPLIPRPVTVTQIATLPPTESALLREEYGGSRTAHRGP